MGPPGRKGPCWAVVARAVCVNDSSLCQCRHIFGSKAQGVSVRPSGARITRDDKPITVVREGAQGARARVYFWFVGAAL